MHLPDIVLFRPEIPPNAGNIIRLCANTGARLHLIHPLGFDLSDRHLRRAGLDYAELAQVHEHDSLDAFRVAWRPRREFALSARAHRPYHEADARPGDALLFGPETSGLPESILAGVPEPRRLRIPMMPGSRSMNLANAVAVVVYDTWRRLGFACAGTGRGA
jgi:tRNA (cytidine/uridine-2'-O-)-methyltransferase